MRFCFLVIVIMLLALCKTQYALAQAPTDHVELGLDYTWMHSNAPPGGCGCFSLQGGSATLAVPLRATRFSIVADATLTDASSGATGFYGSLRLNIFTAGARYSPWLHTGSHWQPFAQAQVGLAHAGGSLASAPYPAAGNAAASFAGSVGGGLDLRYGGHFGLRLVDAEYVVTTLDNNANNRQNNTRLSGGWILRF